MRILRPKKHKSGYWYVHFRGRNHYLGNGRKPDAERFTDIQAEYREWYETRRLNRPRPAVQAPTMMELSDQFLRTKRIERGIDTEIYYTKHLKRWTVLYERMPADWLRPAHLRAFVTRLIQLGLASRTINHDIGAIKTMMRWGAEMELIPEPVDFSGVKKLPTGPTQPKPLPFKQVKKMILGAPEDLRPWLAITFLAFLRPSETVKVVHRQGQWVKPGIFVLDRGKMDERAPIKRHCIFSPLAKKYLRQCKPIWSRLDSFSQAVRRECDHPPSVLRDSAAAYFHEKCGASRDETELALGHYGGHLKVTYYLPAFERLRKKASQIVL